MLELPSIFSDGMVMQRGAEVAVWGRADPDAEVAVEFLGARYEARADRAGDWRVSLAPAEAGGPFLLRVSASGGERAISIEDVLVGDVWLCSGQSNIQTPMSRLRDDFPEEFSLSTVPPIRQFSLTCALDFSGPRSELPPAKWARASAEGLGDFSGVGWFFARQEQARRRIPVGLIVAAFGGAPIEAFMSRESLAEFSDKIAEAERYADAAFRDAAARRSAEAIKEWDCFVQAKDRGLSERWFLLEADDSAWRGIRLPGRFDEEKELRGFCGALWLRRTFVVPEGFGAEGCRLWLGTIADADRVFINGVEVGGTGYRYPPRKYPVPAGLLRPGLNAIAIRVVCNEGDGGVTRGKPFRLLPGAASKSASPIDLRGQWKYGIGLRTIPRPADLFLQWLPTGMFNGMIAPLLPYAARGAIWYQGEANTGKPHEYARLLRSMIFDWRRRIGKEDFPFLVVQLPILGAPSPNDEASPWALLREAQASALDLPATGMVAALDLGEWNDLHPLNKKDLGLRLALAAEELLHGEPKHSPGPALAAIERRGSALLLRFEGCGEGLVARGGEAAFVSVVDDDGKSTRAAARIEALDLLSVDLSGIERPAMILYAWADNPADRQLYGAGGLPAQPFRRAVPEA
jgi:sialate O-acetylesterase